MAATAQLAPRVTASELPRAQPPLSSVFNTMMVWSLEDRVSAQNWRRWCPEFGPFSIQHTAPKAAVAILERSVPRRGHVAHRFHDRHSTVLRDRVDAKDVHGIQDLRRHIPILEHVEITSLT
jgi:hypothetical protein